MPRDARITLDFGDGTYEFRLAWAQLIALQEKTDAGPYFILQRLVNGDWRVQDIAEIIRQGLIGGGKTPVEATKLVKLYVEQRPLMETDGPLTTAVKVLNAALEGNEEERDLGEAGRGAVKANGSTRSPTEDSASPPSTESPIQLDSSPPSS